MTEYKTKHEQKDTNKTQISYNQLKITRMKKVKVFAMMAIAALSISSAKAQFSVGADLVTSYVWRGYLQDRTDVTAGHLTSLGTPSIQPFATYTVGGLTIGSWASGTFTGNVKEVDLYATYAFTPLLSLTITDYNWTFAQSYFNYNKSTDHIFEATLSYAGTESLPLSASVNTMFYGADKTSSGKQAFSTYGELGYQVAANAKVFAGGTYSKGYYGTDGLAFINAGIKVSKTIAISDKFSLPLYGIVSANPYTKNAFFVAGITL